MSPADWGAQLTSSTKASGYVVGARHGSPRKEGIRGAKG